jgi:hypothetical protein
MCSALGVLILVVPRRSRGEASGLIVLTQSIMTVFNWLREQRSLESSDFGKGASFRKIGSGRSWLVALGLWGALTWATPAAAEVTLGLDINYNEAVDQFETGKGGGVDVRFGPRLDLWRFQVTPELSAGLHDFGGYLNPTVVRSSVGGKLALDLGLKPTLFAHFGVGRLRYDSEESIERDASTGMAGDVGAALDLSVLPMLEVGMQGSYNVVGVELKGSRFDWVQFGGHITVILDRSRS